MHFVKPDNVYKFKVVDVRECLCRRCGVFARIALHMLSKQSTGSCSSVRMLGNTYLSCPVIVCKLRNCSIADGYGWLAGCANRGNIPVRHRWGNMFLYMRVASTSRIKQVLLSNISRRSYRKWPKSKNARLQFSDDRVPNGRMFAAVELTHCVRSDLTTLHVVAKQR
jgi:hypothetical protein